MILKRILNGILGILCTTLVHAQATQPTSQPVNGGKQLALPTGQLSDPVNLPTHDAGLSAFDKTMNYLGKNLRKSFEMTLEAFLPFQFKYAIMLDESVEKLTNVSLYKAIDDWYGTRYRYGGTSHRGIDCSAFMQVLGQYAFGWMLPRTAREQYASLQRISREELKEGDLVFFNTTGGVSHVGMYLQNGKFVHSSSSQGVSISSLDDSYWRVRFIGARRAPSQHEMMGVLKTSVN